MRAPLPPLPQGYRVDGRNGVEVEIVLRRATSDDIGAIAALVAASVRGLSAAAYSPQQIEAALGNALAVDSQLILDGTYFVGETPSADDLVAGAGWSFRRTLFGGDALSGRQPEVLDPALDAARVRAFFVHPDWARRGLGQLLLRRCEEEAWQAGFRSAELMATLAGVELYAVRGYSAGAGVEHRLPSGVMLPFVPMRRSLATPQPESPLERRAR